VVQRWHQFVVHPGTTLWSGILFFACALMIAKSGAVPAHEISRWWIAHVAYLGQPPVWRLAHAVHPETAGLSHDNETVMLQLTKPARRQEKLIEALVESGRYQNASEVLRDGLRLVEQRQAEEASRLKALREAARIGVAALDRGDFKEFENIKDLQAYLDDLTEKVISRTIK
jgi:antitoxin ParD1/3/4